MAQKRCICGRSKRVPFCDGSHREEGWTCATDAQPVQCWVLSSQSLASLAEGVAHALGARAGVPRGEAQRVHELIVLFDGTDATVLRRELSMLRPLSVRVVCIGVAVECGRWALGVDDIRFVADEGGSLIGTVRRALAQAVAAPCETRPPRIFLSHAVSDEALIHGAVEAIRTEMGLSVFLCSDSIETGERWHPVILTALETSEHLVMICSRAAARSVFCAYEVGVATGRGIPIHLVQLDETPPPLPIAHLQGVSIVRLRMRKPWLTHQEALMEAILASVVPG